MKSLGVSVNVITRVKQISGVGGKIKTGGEAVIPLGLSGLLCVCASFSYRWQGTIFIKQPSCQTVT